MYYHVLEADGRRWQSTHLSLSTSTPAKFLGAIRIRLDPVAYLRPPVVAPCDHFI